MNKTLKITAIIFAFLFLFLGNVSAGDVTENLKSTINMIIDVLNDPELKKPDKADERKASLHNLLKNIFDEKEFARRSLKNHWNGLSEQEKNEFTTTFIYLLETTYFDKIDDYVREANEFSSNNITYVDEKVKGKYAVVRTKVNAGTNGCVPVDYRMINKNDKWVVCDLVIEGVSIVKNYRAQFDEMLVNNTFEDLMRRLKTKKS